MTKAICDPCVYLRRAFSVQQQRDTKRLRNAEQLTYAETSVELVSKQTHGHLVRRLEQQLLFKSDPQRLVGRVGEIVPGGGFNAAAIPPYMEANIQRGIIDTSQLQSPTAAVAQWGDVLKKKKLQ